MQRRVDSRVQQVIMARACFRPMVLAAVLVAAIKTPTSNANTTVADLTLSQLGAARNAGALDDESELVGERFPDVDVEVPSGHYWRGIALANNTGKLYAVPSYGCNSTLVVDPITGTTASFVIDGLPSSVANIPYSSAGFCGVAWAPNTGKLYAPPYNANFLLIIDPLTNATDTTTLHNVGIAGRGNAVVNWAGIVYCPLTQKLYAAPRFNATAVLVIDPMTNTTDTTTLPVSTQSGINVYNGIAFASNTGKLYCAPCPNAPTNTGGVLVIDPVANTTDTNTILWSQVGTDTPLVGGHWQGIIYVDIVGKLFCAPATSASVLIIDPSTNTTDVSAVDTGFLTGGKYWGIAFSPVTQKLYCAPEYASQVLIVDPLTNHTSMLNYDATSTVGTNYIGAAYAPTVGHTGQIFFGPYGANRVLTVRPILNATIWTVAPTTSPSATPTVMPTSIPTSAPTSTPTPAPTAVCSTAHSDCDYLTTECETSIVNASGYICKCRAGYSLIADNSTACRLSDDGPVASTSTVGTITVVGAAAAVVVVVVGVCVLMLWRRRGGVISAANGPTDFEALGTRLFTEFGVGTQFDVQPDELGLVLTLSDPEANAKQPLDRALSPTTERGLLACLARATDKTRTQPARLDNGTGQGVCVRAVRGVGRF